MTKRAASTKKATEPAPKRTKTGAAEVASDTQYPQKIWHVIRREDETHTHHDHYEEIRSSWTTYELAKKAAKIDLADVRCIGGKVEEEEGEETGMFEVFGDDDEWGSYHVYIKEGWLRDDPNKPLPKSPKGRMTFSVEELRAGVHLEEPYEEEQEDNGHAWFVQRTAAGTDPDDRNPLASIGWINKVYKSVDSANKAAKEAVATLEPPKQGECSWEKEVKVDGLYLNNTQNSGVEFPYKATVEFNNGAESESIKYVFAVLVVSNAYRSMKEANAVAEEAVRSFGCPEDWAYRRKGSFHWNGENVKA